MGLDSIHIRKLKCHCILGVYEEELSKKRDVFIDIRIDYRGSPKRYIDYQIIADKITSHVNASRYGLIEMLAQSIADIVLKIQGVRACQVCVDKPGAPKGAASAAVEIFRRRSIFRHP